MRHEDKDPSTSIEAKNCWRGGNKEILEFAIQKAIDGGYELPRKSYEVTPELFVKLLTDKDYGNAQIADYQRIIFNHDFAKALWGEELIKNEYFATAFEPEETQYYTTKPAWQTHLQQMIIAEDPIKYLGENI